ncbi:MAG: hypothetical protein ABI338_00420 [Gemmatimonadaceae bacterium]
MARTESRGHLYGGSAQRSIRVATIVILFAASYAVLVLAFGIVPLNLMLRRYVSAAAMPTIWLRSMIPLAERTAAAAAACWGGLAITGRGRARLTGSGMLELGAVMSGALAGALDVGLHRVGVTQLARAARAASVWGTTLSLCMTILVALAVTLLLITRSTKVVAVD